MHARVVGVLFLLTSAAVLAPFQLQAQQPSQFAEKFNNLPLAFEENRGQAISDVKYLSRGNGHSLFLTSSQATLTVKRRRGEQVMRVTLRGANPSARISGMEPLPGTANYFTGNQPAKWHTDIPTYARIRYEDVYRGIDLVYYGNQRQLEYDFIVAPGADPRSIHFGIGGEEPLRIDVSGDLVLGKPGRELRMRRPVLYQANGAAREHVTGRFTLRKGRDVGFEVGAYDNARTLVIDPVLNYSTYLGGSGADVAFALAVDGSGNAYITGATDSANFPGTPAGTPAGGQDVFVTKVNAAGTAVVFSTYIGGSNSDTGAAIAVDLLGNIYVAGNTFSTNFPNVSSSQAALSGSQDAFVAKLNPTGTTLLYSTYLGGASFEGAFGIAVDSAGNAYVTGGTSSVNFPVSPGAFQAQSGGGQEAFVTKLSTSGARQYSTYLGGSGADTGMGIAVDSSGNALVTGNTSSANFPTAAPLQSTYAGAIDAFVTKLNSAGSALVYSTYLGGTATDGATAIAVDSAGNAYVTGNTDSTDFPKPAGPQPPPAGGTDAFVTKFSAAGARVYSVPLGGSGSDIPYGIAVDSSGNAYVTGTTTSTNFPLVVPFQQAYAGGDMDAFVAKLNASGAVAYASFLGGGATDVPYGIAVDSFGSVYLAGFTGSANFPAASPLQPARSGGSDAFLTKISEPPTLTSISPSSRPAGAATVSATLTGSNFFAGRNLKVLSSNSGVTVGVTFIVSQTELAVELILAANATGTSNITVQSLEGTSNPLVFTIVGGTPGPATLSSVTPNTGTAGTTFPITATGENFTAQTTLQAVGNSSVTFTNVVVVNSTTLTANMTLPAGLSGTIRLVIAGSSGGLGVPFGVTVPAGAPTLTNMSTTSGAPGSSFTVTFTGTTLNSGNAGTVISSSNPGVTLSNISVLSSTTVSATVTIGANATGTANFTATTSLGTSNALVFTVLASLPVVTGISPNSGAPGTVNVTLMGSNFAVGSTSVASSNPAVTVSNAVAVSTSQVTATLSIVPNATGTTSITATTPSGTSNGVIFTITAPVVGLPTITSIAPTSGTAGATVSFTLTGTNFDAIPSVTSTNPGVTVSDVVRVNATTITGTLTIAATATGTTSINVVNGLNFSNPVIFTVNPAQPAQGATATISHVADGDGWSTSIILVNLDSVPAPFTVQFTGDSGTPFAPSLAGMGKLSTINGILPAGGSQTISTDGAAAGLTEGWARVTSSQSVSGTAIFRLSQGPGADVPYQEAAVPLLSSGSGTLMFPFDNNPGFATGFALAAPDSSTVTSITRRQRSQSGQDITSPLDAENSPGASGNCVALPAKGHCADVLNVNSRLPQNLRGVAQFDATGTPIFGLGIRASGNAFTSIEAVTRQPVSRKIISHIADGGTAADGLWKTTIILVNTDTAQASFTVNFWRDNGQPFPIQLTGGGAAQAAVNGVIPVGGTYTIETAAGPTVTSTGWAEVLSSQAVGGTAIFRLDSSGQEAAVPLLSGGGNRLVLPYSAGGGLALGVALANANTLQDATVTYTIRDEAGNVLVSGVPVPWGDGTPNGSLPKGQHKSFVLSVPNAGAVEKRGVVEFNSIGAPIFVLGIRANSGAFTSVRALGQ